MFAFEGQSCTGNASVFTRWIFASQKDFNNRWHLQVCSEASNWIIKLSLFGYFNRIFYLFSYGIVLFELGTGLRAYDSRAREHRHPYLRGQNREQRTQGFTRCVSWSSLCGSIPTANASGLVVCFFKSRKAAWNDQGIHFVSFWYCIFTWFYLFTLVF